MNEALTIGLSIEDFESNYNINNSEDLLKSLKNTKTPIKKSCFKKLGSRTSDDLFSAFSKTANRRLSKAQQDSLKNLHQDLLCSVPGKQWFEWFHKSQTNYSQTKSIQESVNYFVESLGTDEDEFEIVKKSLLNSENSENSEIDYGDDDDEPRCHRRLSITNSDLVFASKTYRVDYFSDKNNGFRVEVREVDTICTPFLGCYTLPYYRGTLYLDAVEGSEQDDMDFTKLYWIDADGFRTDFGNSEVHQKMVDNLNNLYDKRMKPTTPKLTTPGITSPDSTF